MIQKSADTDQQDAKPRRKTAAEQLAELDQQREQLKAKRQRILAKVQGEERKRDTRRKIVLGAALMADAKITKSISDYIAKVVAKLPDRDREIFDGMKFYEPPEKPEKEEKQ